MLIVLPVFLHCRHHPRGVINFRRLPLFVDTSLPRSISDERHDDESSKLEPRRWRWKHAQFRSIVYWVFRLLCVWMRSFVRWYPLKFKWISCALEVFCCCWLEIIWRNSLSVFLFPFFSWFLHIQYTHFSYWYDAVNCRRLFDLFFFSLSLFNSHKLCVYIWLLCYFLLLLHFCFDLRFW